MSETLTPVPGSELSIIAVDDDPSTLRSLGALLGELPARVVLASSGLEALRRLLEHDPAFIILDVNMPDMDGYETAELIRTRERSRHVPILFLTGSELAADRRRAYAAGAVDFLTKPVDLEALRAKARVFLDLAARTQELRRVNAVLARQTAQLRLQGDQLRASEAELLRKNAEVERASRLKSEFLADMSHELRTPLNSILGFTDLVIEEARLGDQDRRHLEQVQASGRHLLALINDLLDLARIEAGRQALSLERLQASDAVARAVALVEPQARKRSIPIEWAISPDLAVSADRSKLAQVLLNLLANAVRFSPRGWAVEVSARATQDRVRFEVRDWGLGIDPADRPRLFQPFSGPREPRGQGTGVGLGLAISRRLVEQHGGEIGVESTPGEGACFWFTLPAAGAAPAGGSEPRSAPRVARGAGCSPQGCGAVLVVDDNRVNRVLALHLVARAGYPTLEAADGREAVEVARRERPALVLMDLVMPVRDGFQALEDLRADPITAGIPVVALTALAMPAEEARIRAAGFDEHLTKPIDLNLLEDLLRRRSSPRRDEAPLSARVCGGEAEQGG